MTSPCKIWDFGFEQRKRMSKTTKKLKISHINGYDILLHTLIFPENACFQPLTPVNTLLHTQKMIMN